MNCIICDGRVILEVSSADIYFDIIQFFVGFIEPICYLYKIQQDSFVKMEQRSKPVALGPVETQPQLKHRDEFENIELTFVKSDSTEKVQDDPPPYQKRYPVSYALPKPIQPQSSLPPWNYVLRDSYTRPRSSVEDLRNASERQWYTTTRRKVLAIEQAERNRQGGIWNFIKRQKIRTCVICFMFLLAILVLVLVAAYGMRAIDGDNEKNKRKPTAIEAH